jgi:hypothetical protein
MVRAIAVAWWTVIAWKHGDMPERTVNGDAATILREKGHNIGRVYHVWSAGESGCGRDVVIFTTTENKPMTAEVSTETGQPGLAVKINVEIREGWDV